MGASGKEFLLMRMEEESGQMYVPALPKKAIKEKAEMDAQEVIDGGELYVDEVLVDASRISEYLTEFTKQLRLKANTNEFRTEIKGVKISFKSSATKLDYEKDPEWVRIKAELSAREELLKMRFKSGKKVFDQKKKEVPLVPIKSGGGETINLQY